VVWLEISHFHLALTCSVGVYLSLAQPVVGIVTRHFGVTNEGKVWLGHLPQHLPTIFAPRDGDSLEYLLGVLEYPVPAV
jgi:hypothetical protein